MKYFNGYRSLLQALSDYANSYSSWSYRVYVQKSGSSCFLSLSTASLQPLRLDAAYVRRLTQPFFSSSCYW